jgi:hypothetical protein
MTGTNLAAIPPQPFGFLDTRSWLPTKIKFFLHAVTRCNCTKIPLQIQTGSNSLELPTANPILLTPLHAVFFGDHNLHFRL